ncbi:hypothetical protein JTE90_024126 [Oedothorax gibbosus]|uniref:Uncharacterized protein n=1 Tax=Oedothorax gibbosus TaxID=931172 RepID=A0AAV6TPE1_9ARAC|nr:hypothetical protein JTE90_024126 [Oedothorax gibbosus]
MRLLPETKQLYLTHLKVIFSYLSSVIFLYLRSLWLLTSIVAAFGQSEDAIRVMLDEAVCDVLGQHSDEVSSWTPPPDFSPPDGFMRSFVPGTGNREDLSIDAIRPLRVFPDTSFTTMAAQALQQFRLPTRCRATPGNSTQGGQFRRRLPRLVRRRGAFRLRDGFPQCGKRRRSVRALLQVLSSAVRGHLDSARSSVVHIYEINGQRGAPVGVIDLGLSPATSLLSAKKLAFVRCERGESLVVLIDSPDIVQVVYQQRGSYELNHYIEVYYPSAVDIEVYYPSAVDIEAFTVHGYLAVANASVCDVIRLDEGVSLF